ncbi:uncharacterized protein LOC132797598 [Drosophila nasuta]|uniref:uncharacterized protein LOC132797598 n=1 Tax=Drosophila nasuta TaxID=42062 RepID=UPI00295EDDBE|nr:uncharacterized protein LOC132797598 [Drosophila nasuta]
MAHFNIPQCGHYTTMQKRKNEKELKHVGSRFDWSQEPTKMFLELWEENIPNLRAGKKRAQVHKEIALKMHMYKARKTEIKSKMDNMVKKYKKEMLEHHLKGEQSSWEYFDQVHNILKETKYHNVWSTEKFDFSPLEDSDTDDCNDSAIWPISDNETSKKAKTSTAEIFEPETFEEAASVKSELTFTSPERPVSVNSYLTFASAEEEEEYNNVTAATSEFEPESDRRLAIEEAKLAIQREELKLMKNMADELSALHREFLKVYKNK